MIEETTVLAKTPPRTLVAHGPVEAESRMDVEHVARAVVYMATLPLEANV